MAEVQTLIDGQHLNLVEDRGMGGIDGIAAIDAARGNDPDRWCVVLQMADLHR